MVVVVIRALETVRACVCVSLLPVKDLMSLLESPMNHTFLGYTYLLESCQRLTRVERSPPLCLASQRDDEDLERVMKKC